MEGQRNEQVKLSTSFNTEDDAWEAELSNSKPPFLQLSPECLIAGPPPLCPPTNSKHGHDPESHPPSPRLSRPTLLLPLSIT